MQAPSPRAMHTMVNTLYKLGGDLQSNVLAPGGSPANIDSQTDRLITAIREGEGMLTQLLPGSPFRLGLERAIQSAHREIDAAHAALD